MSVEEIRQKQHIQDGVLNMTSYTTFDYEKNEFTEEKDFINSWKWKSEYEERLNLPATTQRILADDYGLPRNTPESALSQIHLFSLKNGRLHEKLETEKEKNKELLHALNLASLEIKNHKKKIKNQKKSIENYKEDVSPYLVHKSECDVYITKHIGRLNQKTRKCTCGLSKKS